MLKKWKKGICLMLTLFMGGLSLGACGHEVAGRYDGAYLVSDRTLSMPTEKDKYRTFYEIFVHSFYDSDGDGIGDLNGVLQKLDYLNDGNVATEEDLGISGIWLMPIMPSDTYHKYDVKDYLAIDPQYGTMNDFDSLLAECKKRDIHVILDLVMNHTSSKHPWFTSACEYLQSIGDAEPDPSICPYVDYYHFSKTMVHGNYYKVEGTDWYYEGMFWSEMPDLNLYNENVRREFTEICRFWLEKGVNGFRLDAVKEFESGKDEKNIEILTWFNQMVKDISPEAYLVGEAWLGQPEYVKYYASGVDSFFDFSFANNGGLIQKIACGSKNASEYGEYVVRGEERIHAVSEDAINAPFYSNHDMDRAAGYYVGDYKKAQTKMAAALALTMSGNAFIYYGDEIGMVGNGKDENKRLGMRWCSDTRAEGMCKNPDYSDAVLQLYEGVDAQMEEGDSLLNWYRKLIRIRNQFVAIRKGITTNVTGAGDTAISVLYKEYEGEGVVLLFNVSPDTKTISLKDLKLPEGIKITGKKPEATLCSGEDSVEATSKKISMPGYSVAVYVVKE